MTVTPEEEIRRAIERATDDELRHEWPYGLDFDRGRVVAFGRDYKPCGLRTTAWVDYEPHRRPCPQANLDALERVCVEWRARPDGYAGWLFGDASAPWRGARHRRAYTDRVIAVLQALGASRNDTEPGHDA